MKKILSKLLKKVTYFLFQLKKDQVQKLLTFMVKTKKQ